MKKEPFQEQRSLFSCSASDLKTDCVSFKIFWRSLLRIFNDTLDQGRKNNSPLAGAEEGRDRVQTDLN